MVQRLYALEYAIDVRFPDKSDVFSFGVLFLEIVLRSSRKRPDARAERRHLVQWSGLGGYAPCSMVRIPAAASLARLAELQKQLASHGLFDVHVKATGDIHIDDHHTNEDVAIAIGTALLHELGDRKGINQFGEFSAPLDEALIHVSLVFTLEIIRRLVSDIAMKWSKLLRTSAIETKFMGFDLGTIMFTMEKGQDSLEVPELKFFDDEEILLLNYFSRSPKMIEIADNASPTKDNGHLKDEL
ncbi:hypothetical protein RHMOL_Rhmol13G0219600 [Rhododendron molle]|uniref:Uncharacterized protein n=1 Tax=Rhododendron molle TaxID=49168 RepID=A0ACC0L9R0_RHOML|nr:hypothetical protein RHMOL_Rhmol13G0219600 [Rhododendron molle]